MRSGPVGKKILSVLVRREWRQGREQQPNPEKNAQLEKKLRNAKTIFFSNGTIICKFNSNNWQRHGVDNEMNKWKILLLTTN